MLDDDDDKSICVPNFDEVSQSTAEMKQLLVLENEGPPYWNSTSGFDFDLSAVIIMSFCIHLPNFLAIRRLAEEL